MVVPGQLRVHHTPKCGSASISGAFHGTGYKAAFTDEPGDEYRWGVVRHPLDRLVSNYTFFCQSDRLKNQPGLREIGYRPEMRFAEFLAIALVRHNDNQHTRFQAVFAGPHRFDRLGRLENLGAEWNALKRRFPIIHRDIGWHHKTSHGLWQEYYDPQVRRWAELVYAADLALYESADPKPPKE